MALNIIWSDFFDKLRITDKAPDREAGTRPEVVFAGTGIFDSLSGFGFPFAAVAFSVVGAGIVVIAFFVLSG
jgi:hypothetical protein